MAKCTKAQVPERVAKIAELLSNGKSFTEIVQYCSENWHITERQTCKYLKKAEDQAKEFYKDKTKELIEEHITYRKGLAQDARIWNPGVSLSCWESIAKFQGVFPTEKKKLEISGEVTIAIGADEIKS